MKWSKLPLRLAEYCLLSSLYYTGVICRYNRKRMVQEMGCIHGARFLGLLHCLGEVTSLNSNFLPFPSICYFGKLTNRGDQSLPKRQKYGDKNSQREMPVKLEFLCYIETLHLPSLELLLEGF